MVRRAGTVSGAVGRPPRSVRGPIDDVARECDRVIVAGTSFGAEAALLTGAGCSSVSTVVAFAPSDVVWAGVTAEGRMTSHWTAAGSPVPFVPFVPDWEPGREPPSYLILVAGGDDQVSPASSRRSASGPSQRARPGHDGADRR